MIELVAYGARLHVDDDAGLGVAANLAKRFPTGSVSAAAGGPVDRCYEIALDEHRGQYCVTHRGQVIDRSDTPAYVIERLCSRVELDLAVLAQGYTFVHAGVVGWRGSAILIPATSGSGKSTLVAELVRRGAQYYSDDWAVFDDSGRVHAFPRPIVLHDGCPRPTVVTAPSPEDERPPLQLALVVATTFRPGCDWDPSILQGARALLPIIDNAVLVSEQPARILRLAATLGSKVVTLESPRPEAEEVAPTILDFADAVLAGQLAHFTSVRRPSAAPASVRATAVGHRPAVDKNVYRAPYLRIEDFLGEDEHRCLLEFARIHEHDFRDSTVYKPDESKELDPNFRSSRTLHELDETLWRIFEHRLRGLLPHVRRELGIPWFRLHSIERQLHVHRSGDFFRPHLDNAYGDVAARRVSAVYYFYETPRRFDGGALCLYDEMDCGGRRHVGPACTALEPLDNSIVFFPSGVTHEVQPVRQRDGGFGASRFTITFWCREDAVRQPVAAQGFTG